MDQISPALQFGGVDNLETCSWKNSSPQSSTSESSSCECIHTPQDFTEQQPEVYSVETMDGNPNRSRDSTSEPLTPTNLQGLDDPDSVLCKEIKTEYAACDMAIGGEIPLEESCIEESAGYVENSEEQGYNCEQNLSVGSIDNLVGYHNQMVDMGTAPPVHLMHSSHAVLASSAPSTSSAAEHQKSKCIDISGGALPACLSFGTHLSPEKQDRNVIISLEGADLWHQFFQAGTEMIITKSGRRMFPGIVVSVGGLDPEFKYSIALEFNPVDNARYKYINTKWVNIGKAEGHCEDLLNYMHPESPATGKHWMSSKISFKKIKVTNNKNHKRGQVVSLNSMHKYQPRVVLYRSISKKSLNPIFTHDLVECTFIGVTAYQNDQVTQLKIDHNPFAKAFRENGADSETYGYGMVNSWPPISPLLSPYGPFSPDGQVGPLPTLSPGCIPSAGASPLPQFNTTFSSWETPPYSPTAASYRASFPNAGLTSPLFPDHRHIPRLVAQDSPPISPLLSSPMGYTSTHHHPYQLHQLPMQTTAALQSQQYAAALASGNAAIMHQQLLKPLPVTTTTTPPESWGPKNEYAIISVTQPYGYDGASTSGTSAYQQPSAQGYIHSVPKIEVDASPVNLMEMHQ